MKQRTRCNTATVDASNSQAVFVYFSRQYQLKVDSKSPLYTSPRGSTKKALMRRESRKMWTRGIVRSLICCCQSCLSCATGSSNNRAWPATIQLNSLIGNARNRIVTLFNPACKLYLTATSHIPGKMYITLQPSKSVDHSSFLDCNHSSQSTLTDTPASLKAERAHGQK